MQTCTRAVPVAGGVLVSTVRQSPNKHPSVAHTHTPLKRSHETTESDCQRLRVAAVAVAASRSLDSRRRLDAHKEDERHLDAERRAGAGTLAHNHHAAQA